MKKPTKQEIVPYHVEELHPPLPHLRAVVSATRKVIGFGMFGLWGPLTNPGERMFSNRVKVECGVDVRGSPYRDYDVGTIDAEIEASPASAIILLWGSSLGCNNCPVVASRTQRTIHGMWGFQASSAPGAARQPITDNVLFAHEVYNPHIFLGSRRWSKVPGNYVTSLHITEMDDVHPGDQDVHVQDVFIAEMKRVIANPND